MGFSSELPSKKKLKQTDSQNPPPSKFLTYLLIRVEPMSFTYPSDLLDSTEEDQLTIAKFVTSSQTPSLAKTDTSVSISQNLI